jgi:hypothetical protein
MRFLFAPTAVLFVVGSTMSADAQSCPGPTTTFTGPNGKTLTLCLDGKYSTCMRDNQRLGFAHGAAKRDCDRKKAQGRVK